jgi:hypothetical protein
MKSLTRIEILLDAVHRPALESLLQSCGLADSLFADHVESSKFDTSLMGACRVVAFADPDAFAKARARLATFVRKCGGVAFVGQCEQLGDG